MKKGLLFTLYNNFNYGNKLQNYATFKVFLKYNIELISLKNIRHLNYRRNFVYSLIKTILSKIKYFLIYLKRGGLKYYKKINIIKKFDKQYLIRTKNYFSYLEIKKYLDYDYYVVGSDQVWNPHMELSDLSLFKYFNSNMKIALSASIAVDSIPENNKQYFSNELKKFKAISVREERGKEIVEELTGRKDIEVLVDPTMLLTAEEWDKVSKRPRMLKSNKYILTYFLGALSDERKKIINKVAKENNCDVINLLDKNDPFFECGPSEFLFLEKNAFLICTDSFHSSVFAILYNTPFLVYDREDNNVSMNSRIDTLLSKFKLEERKYKGKITKNDLKCNYIEAFKILEQERKKAFEFLEKALDIKDSD